MPIALKGAAMKRKPMPVTVGTRLSIEDRAKLNRLCQATRRPPGEVLRLLIQQAETPDLPTFTFSASRDQGPDAQMPQEQS
jgi:hypothetical protein